MIDAIGGLRFDRTLRWTAFLSLCMLTGASANLVFGQAPVPGAPNAAQKNGQTSRSVRKSGEDFLSLFGEAGTASIMSFMSITRGTAESPNVIAECGERLGSDTQAFLAAWSAKPNQSEPAKSTHRSDRSDRSSKRAAPSQESKIKLANLAQSAATWQLARIIMSAPEAERLSAAQEFLVHPKFARTLALVVDAENEDLAKVLRVARLLMAERSSIIESLPELAAAISVVDDTPIVMQLNENIAQGCGPLPIFDHFIAGEKKMLFGLKGIAPELLIYMVDIAASSNEMEWALRTYGGNRSVGDLYDKIEYDFDHLETGKPKKVTVAGWNLPNILRYGGVCADQAYFATTVGKSIGVPCVYTTATDGVLSHAWIGFVSKSNGRPTWEEVGRFGGYQSVEGFIRDPQTGNQISNTQMPMLVKYGLEPLSDRLSAAALRIAAGRLLRSASAANGAASTDPKVATLTPGETIEQVLALIHVAVEACLTDARSWEVIGRAAASGAMTTEQKRQWSSDILTLCGDSYPEFALRTIAPMITSISDITQRQEALDGALAIFRTRGDLAGQILQQQAALYKAQNNAMGAGRCYEMILDRYPNDGPFAIVALQEASKILAAKNDALANVALHERTFHAMEVPVGIAPQFARQSNWYRSGVMLAAALRIVGRERDASAHEQRMANVMK